MTLRPTGDLSLPAVVLLVEDNPIIAMSTEALLNDLGVADVRPASTVAEARAVIESEEVELGILDLKLGDEEDSLPIARMLADRGIAFAFATGFNEGFDLPPPLDAAPLLKKPYDFDDLEQLILQRGAVQD